jgi:hypothetical protein
MAEQNATDASEEPCEYTTIQTETANISVEFEVEAPERKDEDDIRRLAEETFFNEFGRTPDTVMVERDATTSRELAAMFGDGSQLRTWTVTAMATEVSDE